MGKLLEDIEISLKDFSNAIKYAKPKISVVVPVFNTEKYLSKCLFSLINQSLKELEVIVVDDGSIDNSVKIALLFAERDARITIINQAHKLQGSARNNGLKHVQGEYVGFVDSDDWVDEDYFEKLYSSAKKFDADIALATNIRTGNGKAKKRLNITKEEYITDLQGKFDICHLWKDSCPTNKIYRTEFIKNNNISFPEGVYCEDKLFTVKAVYYANGIVTVPDTFYYYFRNPDSTSHNKSVEKERKNDKNNARLEVLKFLRTHNAQVRDGDFCAVTKEIKWFGIPIYRKKESLNCAKYYVLFVKIKEEKL